MQKVNNLQDIFLTKARKENVPVTLFLVNGFQLRRESLPRKRRAWR